MWFLKWDILDVMLFFVRCLILVNFAMFVVGSGFAIFYAIQNAYIHPFFGGVLFLGVMGMAYVFWKICKNVSEMENR